MEIKDTVNFELFKEKILGAHNKELLLQHLTTSTKLYGARHHLDKLKELIPNQKSSDIGLKVESGVVKFASRLPKKTVDYLSELDAFLYSLRSCIDSLLWEINLAFKLEFEKVYFSNLMKKMKTEHKDSKITELLYELKLEAWFQYLNDVRNNLTHRRLNEIAIHTEDQKLYLPSNPKNGSYLRESKFEIFPCIKKLYIDTKEFLEKAYDLLINEAISL